MLDWTSLPTVVGKFILVKWLTLSDLVKLDSACCNHSCRVTLLEWFEHISTDGSFLENWDDMNSAFIWLCAKKTYVLINYHCI